MNNYSRLFSLTVTIAAFAFVLLRIEVASAEDDTELNSGSVELAGFSLKVNAFGQFRYTQLARENMPVVQNFDVALARLAFSGVAGDPDLGYFFQLQASTFGNSNTVSLLDGWISYRLNEHATIQMGRFILPYSRQFYTHPGNLLFTDLAGADYAFNLTRSTGVELSGKFDNVSYYLAATNSIRPLDGSGQTNGSSGLSSVARLEVDVLAPYGYMESSPTLPEQTQLSFGIAGALNRVTEDSGFQNLRIGDSTRNLTIDTGFRWNRLSVQAAVYYRESTGETEQTASKDRGYYLQSGFFLTPGRWEAAGRFSRVQFEQAEAPTTLGSYDESTIGLNYYLKGHNVKLQSDVTRIEQKTFVGGSGVDHQFRLQTQFLY